jgi:hypothetical protein
VLALGDLAYGEGTAAEYSDYYDTPRAAPATPAHTSATEPPSREADYRGGADANIRTPGADTV